jgi:hypothetical protein
LVGLLVSRAPTLIDAMSASTLQKAYAPNVGFGVAAGGEAIQMKLNDVGHADASQRRRQPNICVTNARSLSARPYRRPVR